MICKSEIVLLQHTPLIHFQHDQIGCTLRATEVKPKLDKFIKKKFPDKIKKEWFTRGESEALNYKLRFTTTCKNEAENLGRDTDYDIYYAGNSKKGVWPKADDDGKRRVNMTIIYSNQALIDLIKSCLPEFFIVNNFGFMQGKGFGSFTVEKIDGKSAESLTCQCISNILCNYCGASACYSFPGGNTPFKRIKTVYSLLKSGINLPSTPNTSTPDPYQRSLLFEYMHDELGIGNEKAFLKQQGIAPAINYPIDRSPKFHANDPNAKPKYVRALLGVSGNFSFWNKEMVYKNGKYVRDMETIKISWKPKDETDSRKNYIQRLSSPIFFKVIGSTAGDTVDYTVYMTAKRINDKIYGEKFNFYNYNKKRKIGRNLYVPSKSDIKSSFIDDFMKDSIKRLNGSTGTKAILDKFEDTRNMTITEYSKSNGGV